MVTLSLFSILSGPASTIHDASTKQDAPLVSSNPQSGSLGVLTAALLPTVTYRRKRESSRTRRLTAFAVTGEEDKEKEESVPSWAKPDSDEPPPWARDKAQKSSSAFEVPFYVYLLASTITAIAAVGSAFEYANERPVFGVVNSDSIFYAPLLGFFVFAGVPTSAFLWFKSVQAANKEAEDQDRRDGYL